jgi:NAD(P)-dependent dehydrogenase (short-subunit alcohol dehydrogenase family)
MSAPVALVLGAGPGVGIAVAKKLASNGYKVAVASRSGKSSTEGFLSLKVDFSNPDSIPSVFTVVKKEFGIAPSAVIYDAATLTPPPDQNSIFTTSKEAVISDLNIKIISPYVATQEGVSR